MLKTKLLYFAWLRERIGLSEEHLALPAELGTVTDLVAWLRARGPNYARAFERPEVVRCALDQEMVRPDAAIGGAREIAFFPPVTGG